MRKDLKKFIKILLATITLLVIGYIVIVGWIGVTVLGPALERSSIIEKLENESYKVAILVDCKRFFVSFKASYAR